MSLVPRASEARASRLKLEPSSPFGRPLHEHEGAATEHRRAQHDPERAHVARLAARPGDHNATAWRAARRCCTSCDHRGGRTPTPSHMGKKRQAINALHLRGMTVRGRCGECHEWTPGETGTNFDREALVPRKHLPTATSDFRGTSSRVASIRENRPLGVTSAARAPPHPLLELRGGSGRVRSASRGPSLVRPRPFIGCRTNPHRSMHFSSLSCVWKRRQPFGRFRWPADSSAFHRA